jgi:DNA-binding IclR family transcriptional regulator
MSKYTFETLARGLRILEVFSQESSSLSVTEIAAALELPKGTVSRLTRKLWELGYLERDPETKRYCLGLRVLKLGFSVLDGMDVVEIAEPFVRTLSAKSGEYVEVAVRDGAQVVTVAHTRTSRMLGVTSRIGSLQPVYCTSTGKAQLIDMSRDELHHLLGEGPYPRAGLKTITTLDDLWVELDRVRHQGYAINDEELIEGLRSVAAPIRDNTNQIIAAFSIAVLNYRATSEELRARFAPLVVDAARTISAALGANRDSK